MNWHLQQIDFHPHDYIILNLEDIINYAYNEAKSAVPGTSLSECFTLFISRKIKMMKMIVYLYSLLSVYDW